MNDILADARRALVRARAGRLLAAAAAIAAAAAVSTAGPAAAAAIRPEAAAYRIGPAPAWVRPEAWTAPPADSVTAPGVAYGGRYDLVDDQTRLDAHGSVHYHHLVSEAVTEKGVDDLSHHEIEFDPGYQTLVLHQLDIVRDGRRSSRLRSAKIQVLQRERDLESRVYDGRRTVDLELDDVRPGDVLEFAYTLAGQNPVFGDHHAGGFDMQWRVPVMQLHRSLSWPAGLPVKVRSKNGAVDAAAARTDDGLELRTWDARNVPALAREADTPDWYDPYAAVEWTDYADWAEVARWADGLFRAPAALGPELQAVVERIARQDAGADARTADVLRLVQKQVRYLGIEVGRGSHLPSPPDVVYARRFGDCKEKALLMTALLHALGIEASPALVDSTRHDRIAGDLPSQASFDHVIVRVRLDGRDRWLDPTQAPQAGTLAAVTQADFGRALVLDGRARELAAMPPRAPAGDERRVRVDIDGSRGLDQPADFTVSTLYLARAADQLRDELGDGERGELQRRYVNFYAGSYPGIRVAAPMEVQDDPVANTIRVTEHYAVDGFWRAQDDDGRATGRPRARFDVPDLEAGLKTPEEPIRTMPLALAGPQRTTLHVHARLPQRWADDSGEATVADPAFTLAKTMRVHGTSFDADYRLEVSADHVDAARMAAYVANIGRAQRELGDRLDADGDADGDTAAEPSPTPVEALRQAHAAAGTMGYGMAIVDAAFLVVGLGVWWLVDLRPRARRRAAARAAAEADARAAAGPATAGGVLPAGGAAAP